MISYFIPASILCLTRRYIPSEIHKVIYTHVLLLISITISWFFLESFSFGVSQISLVVFVISSIFSTVLLRTPIYIFSAVIQEICILFAFSLGSIYILPILLFFPAALHPTWAVRIGTTLVGLISISLFILSGSVMWGICVHIIAGTLLFYFREKGMPL